jgi:hypothetical protein
VCVGGGGDGARDMHQVTHSSPVITWSVLDEVGVAERELELARDRLANLPFGRYAARLAQRQRELQEQSAASAAALEAPFGGALGRGPGAGAGAGAGWRS